MEDTMERRTLPYTLGLSVESRLPERALSGQAWRWDGGKKVGLKPLKCAVPSGRDLEESIQFSELKERFQIVVEACQSQLPSRLADLF